MTGKEDVADTMGELAGKMGDLEVRLNLKAYYSAKDQGHSVSEIKNLATQMGEWKAGLPTSCGRLF